MAGALNQELLLNEIAMANPTLTGLALNTSARIVATVWQAPVAATITRLFVPYNTKTGTTPTYRVSMQGLNTSGQPSGTVLGGGSPASATFSPSSLGWSATTGHWITLDNSYAVSAGEFFASVIDYSSGTVDASNFGNFYYYGSSLRDFGFPHAIDYQASWNKRAGLPIGGYGSAGTAYGFPLQTTSTLSINSGGTIEAGMRFTLPAWSGTCTLQGIRLLCSPGAATTLSVKLYSGGNAGDTTAAATISSVDSDFSAAGNRIHTFLFSSPPTMTFGNTYRVSLVADGAVNTTVYYLDFSAAGDLAPWPMGENAYYTTRSGGSWTDTTTRKLWMSLILGDISAAASTSGARLVGPSALVSA